MNKFIPFFFPAVLALSSQLLADPGCKMCERIREENKGKVNPYTYYEDYLKANGGEPKSIKGETTPPEEEKDTKQEASKPEAKADTSTNNVK